MIATWLGGKLSGLIIFAVACTAPFLLIFWIWEAVELHGVVLPLPSGFPLYGPWEFVHGAIPDRIAAEKARDQALKDLGLAQGNEVMLKKGLAMCRASIDGLAAAGKAREDNAQAKVDALLAQMKHYKDRIAALMQIKPTDEKCPVVDQIFTVGAGP